MPEDLSDTVNYVPPSSYRTSAKSKRRSLLPQLGTPRPMARPVALSDAPMDRADSSQSSMRATEATKPATSIPLARGTSVSGSRLGRPRPRSVYQTDSAPPEKSTVVEKSTTSQSMRPPSLLSRPSATPSLGLGRTQSLRRPAATTQTGPPVAPAIHSRTQSTSTMPLARSNTTRPRTNAERPKSAHISSIVLHQAGSTTTAPDSAVTRASTRLAGLSRSASVKARPEVSSSGVQPRAATRPDEPIVPQAKSKEPMKEEAKRTARPAFSTLQQHFTPRKTGKAPTATFLHPAPAATSNILPPELVSLQMDLLQLHLLHENAAKVNRHWEMSAKRELRMKFDEVASMYQVMLEHERSGQEQKNLEALLEWTGDRSSASLVEHIQILSGPLHELPSLVQTGGRFQRLVAAFEQWVSWLEEVRSARESRTEAGLGSIEGLGDAWKAENASLVRKLTSFARDLNGLSQPAAGSSIASIVFSCKTLLQGLLEELEVMQTIEASVLLKEKEWVETRLQGIAADIGSFLVDKTPAWRT
ncbi:uncharacterized protein EKO05_0004397 [Ascochyta rabiei]|uniref:Uncharacterized protein n=1 Tax=Didymella rabiei TaxID=5454 RepID=A0A162Y1B1_DIDRA|nr:uncharacterized protein EKO05_0004397 [Ascochyta rabiei]KZM19781.1 hypothetical protein ST47_g8948 [Ascochyta rabiei]UPX13902.1 hypothetical protein EKO05_0004397 [Ascochyta rabiei]